MPPARKPRGTLAEGCRAGNSAGGASAHAPAPADHLLLSLPNVLPLPHLGASTAEAQRRAGMDAAEALLEALAAITAS